MEHLVILKWLLWEYMDPSWIFLSIFYFIYCYFDDLVKFHRIHFCVEDVWKWDNGMIELICSVFCGHILEESQVLLWDSQQFNWICPRVRTWWKKRKTPKYQEYNSKTVLKVVSVKRKCISGFLRYSVYKERLKDKMSLKYWTLYS